VDNSKYTFALKANYISNFSKGISEDIINKSISSFDINETKIVKKLIKKRHLESQKGAQYLLRHGFPYEVVKKVLK
jgi:SOS response regulatory protein OraA/RecX